MIRYGFWLVLYFLGYWWLCLTGRKHKDAPDWFGNAYNRQAHAWNRWENRRHG